MDDKKKLRLGRKLGFIPKHDEESILNIINGMQESDRVVEVIKEIGSIVAVFDSLPRLSARLDSLVTELKIRKNNQKEPGNVTVEELQPNNGNTLRDAASDLGLDENGLVAESFARDLAGVEVADSGCCSGEGCNCACSK